VREGWGGAGNLGEWMKKRGDKGAAGEPEKVRNAFIGVADSLASHFGDWGAVSRFAADAVGDRKGQVGDGVTYEQNIRPLFRDGDIQAMSFAFDLSSYDDVRANAEAIYEKLAAGSMPCASPWPAEDAERFRPWLD